MRPAIRPGLGIFRRGPSQLQIGAAPGCGLVFADRPGLLEFLRLLDGDRDVATIACLARERIPALADPPEALISALEREQIVVDAEAWNAAVAGLRDELRSLAAAGVRTQTARERLAQRSQAYVEIRSDAQAAGLVTSAIDRLGEVGIEAARRASGIATVVLVVSHGSGSRSQFASLLDERAPHLAVGIDGAVVHIGPFVHPFVTPCVECADRGRAEWDPAWAAIVPQLGRPLAPLTDPEPSAVSATVRSAAAAVIAEEIAAFCDELEPLTATRTVALGPRVHDRTETAVDLHPDCRCRSEAGPYPDGLA
ncbi:MAG: hypothetical protein ACRDO7_06380 [Nocardioidaceae bacterium]